MNLKKLFVAICAPLLSSAAFAAPIEFDTPDAHVIVMRSIDAWSGDSSASEESLTAVAKHEVAFVLVRQKGAAFGYSQLFLGLSDDIIVQGVNSALKPLNFNLVRGGFGFNVEKPVALEPKEYGLLAQKQRDLFKYMVISQGNPVTLPSRVSAKQFFGAILSLGAIIAGGERWGIAGSEALVGSGTAGDVYQLSATSRAALSPIDLPAFDASSYKSIDVRRVNQSNDRLGQVIIAYKNDKTDDAENTALIKAIVTLTGADTTIDAIKLARAEDLSGRQSIWDACVAEGKCKKD